MLEPRRLHPFDSRRMSLHFPLMWELVNLVLIVFKGATFLVAGAPFKEAWLLLGLCAASIALELVGRLLWEGRGLQQPPTPVSDARLVDFLGWCL